MTDWCERDIPDLAGKRMLVTGAASGIGFETARALAQHGAEVIVADCNVGEGAAAKERILASRVNANLHFLPLDLADQQQIRDAARCLLDQEKPLDVLVNNAGIQGLSTRHTTRDNFELTFGIGHLGHFALTGLLLPLLSQSTAPRVVTVSSMVHGQGNLDWEDLQMEKGYNAQRAYNQTKLANLLFARELQRLARSASVTPLQSVAVHPGVSRTGIGNNRRKLGKYRFSDHVVSLVIRLSFALPFIGQDARHGALPSLYAATSPAAKAGAFYGPGGFGEMTGPPAPATVKAAGLDAAAACRLWEVSESLTGVGYHFSRGG